MNIYSVKVKEENGDIYLYEEVSIIGYDQDAGVFSLTRTDGRTDTHLLDYVDEITITKNL